MSNILRTNEYFFFSFTYYYFGKAYLGLTTDVQCAMKA